MSFGVGPHDFDCPCARCHGRREDNKKAWEQLSEFERARQFNLLRQEFEDFALREVAAGRMEIVGKNERGHTLYRSKELEP